MNMTTMYNQQVPNNRINIDIERDEIEHTDVEAYPTSRCEMRNWEAIRRYCLGGRGIITLENPKSGKHHTYEFRKPNNPEDFSPDVLFVYCLVKENTWLYVGMFTYKNNVFRLTRYSKFVSDSEIVEGVRYIVNKISGKFAKRSVERMKFYHEGVCSVCGRKLTTPKSIELGIGPKCKKVLDCRI